MVVEEKTQDIAGKNETTLFVPDDDVIIETPPKSPSALPDEETEAAGTRVTASSTEPVLSETLPVDTSPWIPIVVSEPEEVSTEPASSDPAESSSATPPLSDPALPSSLNATSGEDEGEGATELSISQGFGSMTLLVPEDRPIRTQQSAANQTATTTTTTTTTPDLTTATPSITTKGNPIVHNTNPTFSIQLNGTIGLRRASYRPLTGRLPAGYRRPHRSHAQIMAANQRVSPHSESTVTAGGRAEAI